MFTGLISRQSVSALGCGPGFCLIFCLIHPRPGPFTGVHGLPLCPGHVRSETVVNGAAQSSKACDGATHPWVQIPPPPPLTCTNSRPGGDRRVPHAPRGLIYWSQFRVAEGHTVGISYGCCAWSQRPRTGLNAGERKCARPRGVRATVQGWPGRSATGRRPANSPTAHNDRSRSSRRTRAEPPARESAPGQLLGDGAERSF